VSDSHPNVLILLRGTVLKTFETPDLLSMSLIPNP
jgi:hypothetical protein